jgi:hypothetical protein
LGIGDRRARATNQEVAMFRIARRSRRAKLVGLLAMTIAASAFAAPEKIPVGETERHHIRYDDGTLTINDFCPVLQRPLGPVKSPVFVNGRPVGFC